MQKKWQLEKLKKKLKKKLKIKLNGLFDGPNKLGGF